MRHSVLPYLFESWHELVDFERDLTIYFLYLLFTEAEREGIHLEFGHFDEGGGLKEAVEYSSERGEKICVCMFFSVGFKFFCDILLHAVQLFSVSDDLGPHKVPPFADDLQLLEFLHLDEISQIFIENLDAQRHGGVIPLDAKQLFAGLVRYLYAFLDHRRDLFPECSEILLQGLCGIGDGNDPVLAVLSCAVHAVGA